MLKYLRILALAMLSFPTLSSAADSRMVRVVVPYAPGGNVDAIARFYARQLGTLLNETWVVENISGANAVIGTTHVANAKADGATLLFSADVHSMVPLIVKNVPYDPIKDFQPISRLASAPLLFVVNPQQVRAHDLAELERDIKADPTKYSFAMSGAGSSPQLGAESFKSRIGVNVLTVNYRGTGPAIQDVAGGHVNMMVVTPLAALPLVRAGRLKALAITAEQRFAIASEVPTTQEAGMPGFLLTNSYGFWAPRGIPAEALKRLSDAMQRVNGDAKVQASLRELGVEAMWETPDSFAQHIRKEYEHNRKLLSAAGIKPE